MNKYSLTAAVFVLGTAFSAGASAEGMSKSDYKASKDKISAEYKVAKEKCDSLSGNAKDICVAEAKGKEDVARAELEAAYEPSAKNQYKARAAQAEADYVAHVNSVAERTIYLNCNSWYLGANIPGKPRMFMPLFGFPAYVQRCSEVQQQGYAGFTLA